VIGPCVGFRSRRGNSSFPAVPEIEPLLRQLDATALFPAYARRDGPHGLRYTAEKMDMVGRVVDGCKTATLAAK